jgi:hypothetical protein
MEFMNEEDKGMLRDIFAGLALCGLITKSIGAPQDMAEAAYRMADAMMETRNKDDEEELGIAAVKPKRKYLRGGSR